MMQKRLLVIAAGLLQKPVIEKARKLGYYVIAADGDSHAPGLEIADKGVVVNIRDKETMLKLAIEGRIDGTIHPCSEVAMDVMGFINDQLGLPGNSEAVSVRATNKHLMREAFEAYGAPSPKSFCFTSSEEAWKCFNEELMGDCILKPSRNSGSRGISKIHKRITKMQFEGQFNLSRDESRDNSVMLEQFIDGPEFSVEIIVYNGTPYVLQVTDKKTTEAPHFVELGHNQPSVFPKEIVEKLKDAAIKGVKALKLVNCAAHAELKIMDGEPYIMEIGARLGGDFISTELTHLSTGIDMVAAAIDVALGIKPDFSIREQPRGVCIRYFCPKPGRLLSILNTEVLKDSRVYDQNIYVQEGDIIPEITSSLSRSGHVIVTEDNAKKAIELADMLIREVKFVTE